MIWIKILRHSYHKLKHTDLNTNHRKTNPLLFWYLRFLIKVEIKTESHMDWKWKYIFYKNHAFGSFPERQNQYFIQTLLLNDTTCSAAQTVRYLLPSLFIDCSSIKFTPKTSLKIYFCFQCREFQSKQYKANDIIR